MPMRREDVVYAEGFCNSQEGHAVWPKVLSDDLQPGACGYFNGDGDWVKIVQLTDIPAVEALLKDHQASSDAAAATANTPGTAVTPKPLPDLKPLRDLKIKPDTGSTDWTEKKSTSVDRQAVDLEGSFLPPGAPAHLKSGIQYTCTSASGAVLIAKDNVTSHRLASETHLIRWVEENITALAYAGHWPSIKKRGLWVVRKTHFAPECAKHVFQGKDKSVALHLGVKVPQMGQARGSAAFWRGGEVDSGWTVHRSKKKPPEPSEADASKEQQQPSLFSTAKGLLGLKTDKIAEEDGPSPNEDDEVGVVMFFGGIWFRKHRFVSKGFKTEEEQVKQSVLGPGDEEEEPHVFVENLEGQRDDGEDAFVELRPGVVGEEVVTDQGLPRYEDSYEMMLE